MRTKRPKQKGTPVGSPQGAVKQVRERAAALLADGHGEVALDYLTSALEAAVLRNAEVERLLASLRRQALGTRSERISSEQLALLAEELGELQQSEPKLVSSALEEASLERDIETAKQQQEQPGGRRRRQRSWNARGAELRTHRIDVPETERVCACGREKRHIGDDITRRLEFVPAHFIEHEYHRAKYACGRCKNAVSTAAAPAGAVLERSAADASLLAHVLVSKYADHTPLHRLRRIYERSGVDIPISTLAGWVAAAAGRLAPLGERLGERVLRAHVVRTDATGLKVLDPESPTNIVRGTIWCYVGDDRDVLFRYTPTAEGATGPWSFLRGRGGYIQADAASTFDRLFNGQAASATEVGCWAHARRRFVALSETDCRVAEPLRFIRWLYRVEELADARRLAPAERAALRKQRTAPALEGLRRWLIQTAAAEPPASELAKAAAYSLNHWRALTRFLEDGRIAPDNNLCEQQLRDIALGRKNFLFAGSHDAAARTALLYSLTRTCAHHGVAPLPYLSDVLRKLSAGWPAARLDELLPDRWQQGYAASPTAVSSS